MKKAYLLILDGYGLGKDYEGNAITRANAPFLHGLTSGERYPMSKLKTHGEAVGLPEFQVGGSEAGHITIGAGRAVKLLLTKINDAMDDGSYLQNEILIDLMKRAKKRGKIHLCGLVSDGGIHSFLPHAQGLVKMAESLGIEQIYHHAFLDGRDVGQRTAQGYLEKLLFAGGDLASMGGRFYAMDRDHNWERTESAYRAMTDKTIELEPRDWETVLADFYQGSDQSDYYLPPVCFDRDGQIESDDVVIFWNFRTDRARQLSAALCDPVDDSAVPFDRSVILDVQDYGVFGDYYEGAQKPFSFKAESVQNTLGEVVAQNNGKQLRLAETEKYNHVTFFLSGERKESFANEDRKLVPSPKCPNYAEMPEMSAEAVTMEALKAVRSGQYDLVVHNFANPDLVGHSGNFDAVVQAVECMDRCCGELIPEILAAGYSLILTADHGNADYMINPDGSGNASHTKALTPCVLITEQPEWQIVEMKDQGTLADIAPTVLELMGLDKPSEMTGESLLITNTISPT